MALQIWDIHKENTMLEEAEEEEENENSNYRISTLMLASFFL
jgi:hypothetical protein